MRDFVVIIIVTILLFGCKEEELPDYYVNGVSRPVISLNGSWKINLKPEGDFHKNNHFEEWNDIQVPGECMMQGFAIKHDKPFVYKKDIFIPSDYRNKRVLLQFDGVYSYARVWVNGKYVRDHSGGFTRWQCDITPFVEPGEKAVVTVEVTDKTDDISYGSGYTLHLIGGILRDVKLLSVPENHPEDIGIHTIFDKEYKNARLMVSGKVSGSYSKGIIKIELTNDKKRVPLDITEVQTGDKNTFHIENEVKSPEKWDAEHPNLYKLLLSYYQNGDLIYQKTYDFGFREVKVEENKLLVNGKPVKLRGICHHDVHPLLGRISTPEYELKDVLLAKEANINFFRTSHYPPTEDFLKLCDQYGIYVEDETDVCFVDTWRRKPYFPGATQNDSLYTKEYISRLSEMVQNHKNHPSVIMWSIANESRYGTNFKRSYDWVKKNEPTRPVIFSYPGMAGDSADVFDILSMHYPPIDGTKDEFGSKVVNFNSNKNMPVLCDEMMHNPCYNFRVIKKDPNVREFGGQGLDQIWANIYDSDSGLGGAIWAMTDEIFMVPDTTAGFKKWWGFDSEPALQKFQGPIVGSGEWGITDVWRRRKPEFWNTKKSYTPFKVLKTEIAKSDIKDSIKIPVYNRFNFTDFNELKIEYTFRDKKHVLKDVSLPPHTKGNIFIPVKEIKPGEIIVLEAYDRNNRLIDKYHLKPEENPLNRKPVISGTTEVSETQNKIHVGCNNGVTITIDKNTGLIEQVKTEKGIMKVSGPYVNLQLEGKPIDHMRVHIDEYGDGWKKKHLSYSKEGNNTVITVKGRTDKLAKVDYQITIRPDAGISVQYFFGKIPKKRVHEVGIKFDLDKHYDSLSWKRKAYWSYYMPGSLSAPEMTVPLYSDTTNEYRKKPKKEWVYDTKSFYYNGTEKEDIKNQLTFIAKATKENIYQYDISQMSGNKISVFGNANVSCRIAGDKNGITLYTNNLIDYINIGWGNYQRDIILDSTYTDKTEFMFHTNY